MPGSLESIPGVSSHAPPEELQLIPGTANCSGQLIGVLYLFWSLVCGKLA